MSSCHISSTHKLQFLAPDLVISFQVATIQIWAFTLWQWAWVNPSLLATTHTVRGWTWHSNLLALWLSELPVVEHPLCWASVSKPQQSPLSMKNFWMAHLLGTRLTCVALYTYPYMYMYAVHYTYVKLFSLLYCAGHLCKSTTADSYHSHIGVRMNKRTARQTWSMTPGHSM